MKKNIVYILLALLLSVMTGCMKEDFSETGGRTSGADPQYPSDGWVQLNCSVMLPGEGPATKAMAELPGIDRLTVAIFGKSALKESVEVSSFDNATTNGNNPMYNFTVKLPLMDSKNLRVHILANCAAQLPFKSEQVVMRQYAYTTGNQDAYWYRFELPNGIELKKVYNAATDMMDYVSHPDPVDPSKIIYEVTDEVKAAFRNLPLLRNFAKISVESVTPQLVLDPTTTMTVINMPDRGSLAPMQGDEFLPDYYSYTYDYLRNEYDSNAGYLGFTPIGAGLVNSDPALAPFRPCGKDGSGNVTGGVFMYETSLNAAEPAYIIIHGLYYPYKTGLSRSDWTSYPDNPEDFLDYSNPTDGYYKIDFMDADGYYAILRNFRYHIRITGVSKPGATTPSEAASTGGSGGISSNKEASALTDFSDGYGRIAVNIVERTFVESQPSFYLKYKFIPDIELIEGNDEHTDNRLQSEGGPVEITIGPKKGPKNVISSEFDASIPSGGTTLGSSDTGYIKVMDGSDSDGFRTFYVTINDPHTSDATEQIITITGHIDEYKKIERQIRLILMPRQTMMVECLADVPDPSEAANAVEDVMGQGVNVNISIPTLLPESMFPLIFKIESDKLSITPNTQKYEDENLPVETGISICDGQTSSQTFHYVKTLNYDDYKALTDPDDDGYVSFTCHFKTNQAQSASTIYVDNEYFNKGSDDFVNYSRYEFRNLAFNNYGRAANQDVNCTFQLDETDNSRPRVIQVKLEGMTPRNNQTGWNTTDASQGLYTFETNATSAQTVTLNLHTITNNQGFPGYYNVTLKVVDATGKEIYHEASVGSQARRITLNPSSMELIPGESKRIEATLWPETLNNSTITWSSSNTAVATVDENGRVTAVAPSPVPVNITASCGNASAACRVTVKEIPVTAVSLDRSSMTLHVGESQNLTCTVFPFDASNKNVTWESSNTDVVTVDSNGRVTATGVGVTTVTVTTVDGGYSAVCTVNVEPTPVQSVSLNHTSYTLRPEGTVQLTATVSPANATNKAVTWQSSNTSVATVSDGLVTAVAPGNATITVTTVDGNKTATCSIVVQRRTWHAASYAIDLSDYTNAAASSFTTSPQNVVFVNTERDNPPLNYLRYFKAMGIRTNNGSWLNPNYSYSSGYFTVTAPPQATYDGSRIIGISMAYDDGYDDRPVTYQGNGNTSLSGTAAAWGTTNTGSTSEVSGYNTVRVTMSCTTANEYDNRNRLTSLTVYYGYFTWENP